MSEGESDFDNRKDHKKGKTLRCFDVDKAISTSAQINSKCFDMSKA